jgi:hypothetical protein
VVLKIVPFWEDHKRKSWNPPREKGLPMLQLSWILIAIVQSIPNIRIIKNMPYKEDMWHHYYNSIPFWSDLDKMLLIKGHHDNTTITEMSVSITYTFEFANSLGVFQKWGVQLIAAFILKVIIYH